MDQNDGNPLPGMPDATSPSPFHVSRLWKAEELEQLVIITNKNVGPHPVDIATLSDSQIWGCMIVRLGRPILQESLRTSDAKYREILTNLIAAGVRMIPRASLAEANAKYLEEHPDAEDNEATLLRLHKGSEFKE